MKAIIDKLEQAGTLSREEMKKLLIAKDKSANSYLMSRADYVRRQVYGNSVYVRGLIEFTNVCKNNCFYCGIRKDNNRILRYRLKKSEILSCCSEGYELGFRTFVLQGGEDPYWTDDMLTDIVSIINRSYPDCAITLSIGERSSESYQKLFIAGADRYLLRHETSDAAHYMKLHPKGMSFQTRMKCLQSLKDIGFQTGCGFMVGSPYQTIDNIIDDIFFIKNFEPHMVGIGPFIPASGTPFEKKTKGSAELTIKILSIIRLCLPHVLLPATTALGTAKSDGQLLGILAGANVIMPNLSPYDVRKKYLLYDGKIATGNEAAESIAGLSASMKKIGFDIVTDRGDYLK